MLLTEKPRAVAMDRQLRFNTGQYFEMIRKGIVPESPSYELLDGIIVLKDRSARGESPMSIGKLHNLLVQLFGRLNAEIAQYGCYVQLQGPIELSDTHSPEPDGAIIAGMPDDYLERLPGASDVFCVVEISDASLAMDRSIKLAIYADAGIPQYVIANLADKQFEVHEVPKKGLGVYSKRVVFKDGETVPFLVGKRKRHSVPVSSLMR